MKLLVRQEQKEQLEGKRKPVVISSEKVYYVENISKDFHCSDGVIKKEDLQKTGTITSSKGKEFIIFDSQFIDYYKNIKKTAQTIPLKDIGFIIAETGINSESIVVDSGSGSGGSACFIAKYAKKVYTYDISEINIEQTKKNIEYFKLTNIEISKADIYSEIPIKDVDVILLDVPEPWNALNSVNKSLKIGGFVVAYCPQIIQAQEFVNEANKLGFMNIKSVELIERDWKIEGSIVRPRSLSTIHSGFITIMRKIN